MSRAHRVAPQQRWTDSWLCLINLYRYDRQHLKTKAFLSGVINFPNNDCAITKKKKKKKSTVETPHYVLEILGRNRIKSTRCSKPGGANMRDLRNQLLQLLVALVGWGVPTHTPTFSDINNGSENKLNSI